MPNSPTPVMYLLAGNGGMASWWRDVLPHFRTFQPCPLDTTPIPVARRDAAARIAQAVGNHAEQPGGSTRQNDYVCGRPNRDD